MGSRKKICLIAHECGYYKGHGGIASYMNNTARGLGEIGLDVHVIFINGRAPDFKNVTEWKIKDNFNIYENSKEIDRILSIIKPDYVEAADFMGLASYTLIKRAVSGLDYVCTFITNHHTGIREVWEWGTGLQFMARAPAWMREMYQYERAQTILCDANFSPSNFLAEYLAKLYQTRFYTCPSYYPLNKKSNKDQCNERKGWKILSVGRFELRKKQDLLIRAAVEIIAEGYDIHLTLIGNSNEDFYNRRDYMETCYSLIPHSIKTSFSFYDFIPYDALKEHYSDYDIFVIPSPYENFPTTALEAINHDLLVIGSSHSGIVDMSGEVADIVCFEKNSIESIKKTLIALFNMNPTERERVQQTQKEALVQLVSLENSVVQRINMFEGVKRKESFPIIMKEDIVFIAVNNDGCLNSASYKGSCAYIHSEKVRGFLSSAKYLIISSHKKEKEINTNDIYFPDENVISARSFHNPYGTVEDMIKGKKTFTTLILNIKNVEINHSDDPELIIARQLYKCRDVIFSKEPRADLERALGVDLMYQLDLMRYKIND